MKQKPRGGKYVAPTVCALLVILLAAFYLALFLFAALVAPVPFLFLFILIPGAVIVGVIVALIQRYKEIEGGEEDEASKY